MSFAKLTPVFLLSAALAATSPAQQDAAPPDLSQILQILKGLKDQQAQQVKATKQKALQETQSAAASPAAASAAWVEAIRQTQFEGVEKEGTQFREWREKEGGAYADKEVQSAAQLYFRWLALTLQRSMGSTPKDLLPAVVQYTKDLAADRAAVDALSERARKEKDLAGSKFHGARKDKTGDDDRTVKVHDQILDRSLPGSAPVKAMRMDELLKVEQWEMTPGNVEGMFSNIILPELRAQKDPRVFEYWDMKIRKEADLVKDKPSYDQDKFNKEKRPALLWSRAQEYLALGQRNRGIAEMLAVIRANPQHPSLGNWINTLENQLNPPPSVSAAPPPSASATPPAAASAVPAAAPAARTAAPAPQ